MSRSGPKPDPLLGVTLAGKYELVEQLGIGGCGVVYRAIQHPVGREVAVKTLRPGIFDEQATARFFREAESIGHLTHATTVTLYDYGEDQGYVFMVMELVRGETLKARIKRVGALPASQAIDITRQVLEALAEAHALGIVHRDLKPSNLMLLTTPFGEERVRLLDFGIAKLLDAPGDQDLTQTGYAVGTIAYMAPEQAGGNVGPAADLYSMGVVLYQMLSGTVPFKGSTTAETLAAALRDPPAPLPDRPGITAGLRAAVVTALAKRPAARFRSAAEMAQALARSLAPDDADLTTSEEMFGEATAQVGGGLDARVWVALALVVVLTAGATVWWRTSSNDPASAAQPPTPAVVAPAQVVVATPTPDPPPVIVDAAVPDAAPVAAPVQPKPPVRRARPKKKKPAPAAKKARPTSPTSPAKPEPTTLRRY